MCGICGVLDLNAPSNLLSGVHRMRQVVEHRGPDDREWIAVRRSGEVLSDSPGPMAQAVGATDPGECVLALGHRRLSIIDLSPADHQPMSDESGRY